MPNKIYSTKDKQFKDAISAIYYGREMDRRKAVEAFPEKYQFVRPVLEQKQPELVKRLNSWKELYREEVKNLKPIKNIQEK